MKKGQPNWGIIKLSDNLNVLEPVIKYKMTMRKLVNLKKFLFSKCQNTLDRDKKKFKHKYSRRKITQEMLLLMN